MYLSYRMNISRIAAALFAIASIFPCAIAGAQDAAAPSPNLAGIAHVALRVHDLDASIAFYQKLGFVKAFDLSRDGKVYEAFIKINDHQYIELYPTTEKDPQTGFLHVCFEGADLHSVHDYYVAHGLTPNNVRTAGAGNLLFTMQGPITPTGPQNMEYTQYMPGSLHSKDFGQHLGPDRVADKLSSVAIATNDPAAATAFYLDKLGFTKTRFGTQDRLAIPGSNGATLQIVPAQPLGFLARIFFEASLPEAKAKLEHQHIAFTSTHLELTLTDPDGNQILIDEKPGTYTSY